MRTLYARQTSIIPLIWKQSWALRIVSSNPLMKGWVCAKISSIDQNQVCPFAGKIDHHCGQLAATGPNVEHCLCGRNKSSFPTMPKDCALFALAIRIWNPPLVTTQRIVICHSPEAAKVRSAIFVISHEAGEHYGPKAPQV